MFTVALVIFSLIVIALLFVGLYHVLCYLGNAPTPKASKAMLKIRGNQSEDKSLNVYLNAIATPLSKHVRINKVKLDKIEKSLIMADIDMDPKLYVTRPYVLGAGCAILTSPLFFFSPIFGIIGLGASLMLWYKYRFEVTEVAKKRRAAIEREIPQFANSVSQKLRSSRDVLAMIQSYRPVAGKEFGKELDRVVAAMKTGNYEESLIQMESRVGSAMLSDVTRGLLGVLRGDDQHMYFQMICFDMRQIEQERLKKEAEKRPRAISKYSMFMLLSMMLIFGVVLALEVMEGAGTMFG